MPNTPQRAIRTAQLLCVATLCVGAADSRSIELSAGQWTVDHTLKAPEAGMVHDEQSQFCLTEANNTITFDRILADLNFGQCTTRNVVIAQGRASADMTCVYEEDGGVTITGTIEGTYSSDRYRVVAVINENGANYEGIGRRTGACGG